MAGLGARRQPQTGARPKTGAKPQQMPAFWRVRPCLASGLEQTCLCEYIKVTTSFCIVTLAEAAITWLPLNCNPFTADAVLQVTHGHF